MQFKKFVLTTAAVLFAPLAIAGPQAGDRSFTLSGNGTSDDSFDTNNFGVAGSIGKFTSDNLEIGVRQSVNAAILDDEDDNWAGSTRVYGDWHFATASSVVPFVGANIGGLYGEDVKDTGSAGIDAGLKLYVKNETFIQVMAEYQFLFDDADELDSRFNNGAFFYTFGIGFNF